MGQQIERTSFTDREKETFQARLFAQLEQLKTTLAKSGFGDEQLKMGAELEMYLIDSHGNASPSNEAVISSINDQQFQHELNQYNLELNLSAVKQTGSPFSQLKQEINHKLAVLNKVTEQHQCSALPIGILPTIKHEQLNSSCMTGIARYACLADKISKQRGEHFRVSINGDESLDIDFRDICAEGANTSFQVHLMCPPENMVKLFNAAQLTLPFVTAIAANSPIFLGKNLWHETRIALFKQSLDVRRRNQYPWHQPTRVNFGHGWVRNSIWELFAQSVSLYPPLMPYLSPDNTKDSYHELCFHMGTIWPWNRPVFSTEGNGHIRLEFRAIPAGPTPVDMIANAAFAIGLANGFIDKIDEYCAYIPFQFADYNFYRAAQYGLDAKILWPHQNQYQPQEIDIKQVMIKLLPIAHQGLTNLNISAKEADYYLNIIEQRLINNVTGAIWQKQRFNQLTSSLSIDKALEQLVKDYQTQYQSHAPVSTWE
ncbi:glutamate-cysteine ligase family protein [Thalassotalea sediminis]|uniref:glutamate-cysteine ligase family protein n=1 Tax=Thalassotalea sediminis TaxID=1759089 RepID=UPI002572F74A|nr:glutamate-cysteine ligase family protein [Thalassotalea sediminis]